MTKYRLAIALLIFFGQISNSHAFSGYKDSNFGSRINTVYGGPLTFLQHMNDINDSYSSVKVDYDECLLLAKDDNLSGTLLILSEGNYPSLAAYGFNDETTGFIVYKSMPGYSCSDSVAYFYKDSNQGGRAYPAPVGMTFSGVDDYNDKASSYKIPPSVCVLAYKDANYGGTPVKLVYGANTVLPNDWMSSFTVWPYNDPHCTNPVAPY